MTNMFSQFKFVIALISSLLFLYSTAIASDTVSSPSYIFNIHYEDAQNAISKTLTKKLSSEQSDRETISAIINGRKSTPLYSSNKPINVEIRGLRVNNTNKRWNASMIIMANDNKVISALPIAGRYIVMSEVPVLKRALRNGKLIRLTDLKMKSFPQNHIKGNTVNYIEDLIGKTPIRTISSNRPIRTAEISAPALVKRNSLVQMRYKTANMEITTTGKALEKGAKGDVVEVLNTTSKRTTRAVVSGHNIVDVLAQGIQTSQITPQTKPITNQAKIQ